jgi:hypothetical protein
MAKLKIFHMSSRSSLIPNTKTLQSCSPSVPAGMPGPHWLIRARSGWEGPVAQAIEAAAVDLRLRTDRIASCRHTAENAGVGAQHALTEELLPTMPPARQ